jgi:hypothetical protein
MVLCPKCKLSKPEEEFGLDRKRNNGRYLWCLECTRAYGRATYAKHKEKRRTSKKLYHKAVKAAVFTAYGKVCQCCGETEELFLDIDHMDNDGAEHRKKYNLNCGTQFYMWLIKNKFPANFQTLCCNCNRGKFRNGGICPHQTPQEIAA